jgi:hypothetical protein
MLVTFLSTFRPPYACVSPFPIIILWLVGRDSDTRGKNNDDSQPRNITTRTLEEPAKFRRIIVALIPHFLQVTVLTDAGGISSEHNSEAGSQG